MYVFQLSLVQNEEAHRGYSEGILFLGLDSLRSLRSLQLPEEHLHSRRRPFADGQQIAGQLTHLKLKFPYIALHGEGPDCYLPVNLLYALNVPHMGVLTSLLDLDIRPAVLDLKSLAPLCCLTNLTCKKLWVLPSEISSFCLPNLRRLECNQLGTESGIDAEFEAEYGYLDDEDNSDYSDYEDEGDSDDEYEHGNSRGRKAAALLFPRLEELHLHPGGNYDSSHSKELWPDGLKMACMARLSVTPGRWYQTYGECESFNYEGEEAGPAHQMPIDLAKSCVGVVDVELDMLEPLDMLTLLGPHLRKLVLTCKERLLDCVLACPLLTDLSLTCKCEVVAYGGTERWEEGCLEKWGAQGVCTSWVRTASQGDQWRQGVCIPRGYQPTNADLETISQSARGLRRVTLTHCHEVSRAGIAALAVNPAMELIRLDRCRLVNRSNRWEAQGVMMLLAPSRHLDIEVT